MNVKYNAHKSSVLIDDIAAQNTQLLNIIAGLNGLVAILHLVNHGFDFSKAITYVFLFLLIFSVGSLLYINLKRSSQKEIPLDEIENLQSSTSFNRVNYDLILKNGKKRRLYFGDDFESIDKIKLLIDGKQI